MRVVVRGEGLTGGENGRYAKPRTALVCAYRHTCLDGVVPKLITTCSICASNHLPKTSRSYSQRSGNDLPDRRTLIWCCADNCCPEVATAKQ